jgi:hypothetical protein
VSTDTEHVVLTLPRGERGELRISRATFKGSAPFTKLQLWYPESDDLDAALKPGKVVTIKDHELAQVIVVLIKIDKKQFADKLGGQATAPAAAGNSSKAPAARAAKHRTISGAEAERELERKLF